MLRAALNIECLGPYGTFIALPQLRVGSIFIVGNPKRWINLNEMGGDEVKKISIITTFVFVIGATLLVFAANPAFAKNLGKGSVIEDNLHIGTITKIGNRQLTISTKFEKSAKTYTLHLHPDGYVMTASRGQFKKFRELKKGNLIAAYGYLKGGKWQARRIDILDPKDYLVKRLAADAKAGFYYKHER